MKKEILLSILLFTADSLACTNPIATTTMYYTPSALQVCKKWYYGKKKNPKNADEFIATDTVCDKFESEVKMQGSGRYNPKETYTYLKEVIVMSGAADSPNCPTTIGRAGRCLITYVSVAADPKKHRMGDYISMPGLKGKKLTLPDGTIFTHPGYLRVDDVGGAIKGANRFDFYAGNMDLSHEKNSFGYKGPADVVMEDKKSCPTRKKYENVWKSSEKAIAKKAIEDSLRGITFNSIVGIPPDTPKPTYTPVRRTSDGKVRKQN